MRLHGTRTLQRTLITLFLIPVLYRLVESRRERRIDVETDIHEGEGAA